MLKQKPQVPPFALPRSVENISTTGPLNRGSLGYPRDDKGEGIASVESSYCMRVIFHLPGWAKTLMKIADNLRLYPSPNNCR
jgi:hypothetical protein